MNLNFSFASEDVSIRFIETKNNIESEIDKKIFYHNFTNYIDIQIDLKKDQINPDFVLEFNGNKHIFFNNPKLIFTDLAGKNIDHKIELEYDFDNYKYNLKIMPTDLIEGEFKLGKYRFSIETKTIVNFDNYSVKELMELSPLTKDKQPWELSYYIANMKDGEENLIDGLNVEFNIE